MIQKMKNNKMEQLLIKIIKCNRIKLIKCKYNNK